jgi:CheY-like chemotaxis protein/CHASE3 domain sensor protein/HPt (histidine-containing phosphotransfer) domain-containing protein
MSDENDWPASAGDVAIRERRVSIPVAAGFAITLAIIAGIMSMVYSRARTTMDAEKRIEHTRDVAAALDDAAGAINETDQANAHYVLTGATRYLDDRKTGADAVDNHLMRLRGLVVDDSVQRGRLAALEPLWAAMLSRLPAAGTTPAARTAQTEFPSDDIPARLAEMQRGEGLLLAQQFTELQRAINTQPSTFMGLLVLASSMLCIFYIQVVRAIRQFGEAGKVLKNARSRAQAESSFQNTSVARARCDIRSALTAILGYCDIPLEPGTTAQDRFDSIRGQASHIVSAVNDILNMPDIAAALPGAARMETICSNAQAAYASPNTLPPATRFVGRVLLAEDNRDLQKVIKFYLQTAGAEVTIVSDGQLAYDQALLALKGKKPFDLILMDVQMPQTGGRAATILLRDAGYTHPIVALTANATDQERSRCFAAGCNGFLAKPVDQEEFLRTMRRYLRPRVPSPAASNDQLDVSIDSEFAALRESFQAEIPSRIAEIATAVSGNNFNRIADLTHQLKGTAGCYGLSTICAAAAALHDAAECPERRGTIQQCFQTLTEQTAPSAMPEPEAVGAS